MMQLERLSSTTTTLNGINTARPELLEDDVGFWLPPLEQQPSAAVVHQSLSSSSSSSSSSTSTTGSSSRCRRSHSDDSDSDVVVIDKKKNSGNNDWSLYWCLLFPPLLGVIFLFCFRNLVHNDTEFLDYEQLQEQQQQQQQQQQQLKLDFSTVDAFKEDDRTLLQGTGRTIRLALIPKATDDSFFYPAGDGCINQAMRLTLATGDNVTCTYIGPLNDDDDKSQAPIMQSLIDQGLVDGIAISARHEATITPVIDYAMKQGIPVVTFDSDAPKSQRITYVGTDQYFMGEQIGKVLKQLKPEGGTYATLAPIKEPNLADRLKGLRTELMLPNENGNILWKELPGSPADNDRNMTLTMEIMQTFADQYPTAIAPVLGHPLRSGHWQEFVDLNRDKNITYVCGDAGENELPWIDKSYVEGLVGQLPYAMGSICIRTLYDVLVNNATSSIPSFIGTNVVHHLQVPLILPPLKVNHNLLGILKYVGYSLFCLITAVALMFLVWLFRNRNMPVVRVAQPIFLIMVIVGIVVLASTMIPLSFDDGGNSDQMSHREKVSMCMTVPWLASTGFTITFSALYAKTRRVNLVFRSDVPSRVFVSTRDVLLPFFALMTANMIVLTLWTALDPLVYTRQNLPGTDGWKRVIATYGSCRSSHSTSAFLAPLGLINLSVLILANWQAYEARSIESEFAESKYIALAMASLLQTMLCCVPVILVVGEAPRTFYLVTVMMLFVICTSVMLLIFVPKVRLANKMRHCNNREQRRRILDGAKSKRRYSIMELQQQQQLLQQQLLRIQQQLQQRVGSSASNDAFPSLAAEASGERFDSGEAHGMVGWQNHASGTTTPVNLRTCNDDVTSENDKNLSLIARASNRTGGNSRQSGLSTSSGLPSPAASEIGSPADDYVPDLDLDAAVAGTVQH